MKVLLAKCPRAYTSHFEENSESLALGYLAAALRRAGYQEVDILDASLTHLSLAEMVEAIAQVDYGLIGFTISDQTFLESTFECVERLRRRGISAHIVLGGYTPTFQYSETLEACAGIDSVVRFDGEYTLLELVKCLQEGRDWTKVPGIAYRNNGSIKVNPPPPLVRNLDELPFPSHDALPYVLKNLPETGVVSVSGSRGCYADCSFCSIRAFYDVQTGPPIRLRSVKNIVDEIEHLVNQYGLREIVMVDDVFVIPNKLGMRRIEEFGEEFDRRNLHVMLSISERVCNVNDEIFSSLRRIGVRQVLVGIEAGSDELLEYYNKETTIDQNRHAIEVLERLEIDPTVSFINFAPVTTLEQLRQNLAFLLSLRVNFLQGLLNRFQIYAGTQLGDQMLRSSKLRGKFPKYDYVSDDPRTDVAYGIVKQSLGLFLTIAFELKRVQRNLRRELFDAEAQGADLKGLRKARVQLRELQQDIMVDAAHIFESVLDFVDSDESCKEGNVQDFIAATRNNVRQRFGIWCRQIAFFEKCSPYLRSCSYVAQRTENYTPVKETAQYV
jgi:radical SAM superfamily enzyme YgiQ (UPF0313 family)